MLDEKNRVAAALVLSFILVGSHMARFVMCARQNALETERFGVQQLAAAFSVDARSRQLAGGLNSALRTVGYQAVHSRATGAQQAARVEDCHSAKRQQATALQTLSDRLRLDLNSYAPVACS
jgi:hypothetical protein